MKKVIIVFALLLASAQLVAQDRPTMHAIIFADTDDKSIGKGEAISLDKFTDMLRTVCNTINYSFLPDIYKGANCRSSELQDCLKEFNCDTNDIVVFCYLGHGTRSAMDTSVFPQMCLHESNQSDFIPLINVTKSLATHRAHLTVVIGDCCNVTGEYVMPKENIIAPAARTNLRTASISLISDLFVNTSGVITMCATKPETFGWSNQETGSYFLNSFIQAIEDTPINSIRPGNPWGSVMDIVMKDLWTKEFFLRNNPTKKYKMTPCYRIEPRYSSRRGNGNGRIIRNPDKEEKLRQAISDIANIKLPETTRKIHMQDVLMEFAPNARVRTVSADGKMAFNMTYTAMEYLQRIILSKDIINVNIKNVNRNELGKITLLEIHEIYSEY